ncbi:MAG: hypothetical protein ABF261_03305 [Candidatus Arcticimaribacter sp.]
MKKLFYLFFLFVTSLYAQVPSWTVDETLFEFSMTFVAKINIGGERLTSSSDLVGAFVGGQCRGVANPTYIASSDAYFVYLTVFGNTTGETVTFKVYRADTDEEITISRTVDFESNQHIGSRFQSFSIAVPPLRSDAELTSFGFNDQVADSLSISDDGISFFFVENIDPTQLTPNFSISDGARAFVRQVAQTSGVGVRDFSSPVVYQIMSEDESVLKEMTISVFGEFDPPDNTPDDNDPSDPSSDNDNTQNLPQASFNISESNENTQVNEDGSQDNFIVFLNRQPQVQAVFTVTSSNPEEVRVLNPEIIFTPENINLAQFVYLEGVDDDIQDGNQTSTITIQVDPTRSDAMFASLPAKTFTCITLDNDNIPRIIVFETNGSTQVDESESEDTVFVSLGNEPTSEVNINIGVDDITEVSVNPSSLTFTPDNWFIPQATMVNGVDDELVDGSQKSNLTFSASTSSSDQNYASVTPVVIEVTTTDNDASSNEDGSEDDNTENENEDETPVAPPVFYKRNAVCYNGGGIKVEYATAGTSIVINLNGRKIATKNISNGEVIFSDLERGSYIVEAANVVKVINIDLDE